LYVAKENIVCTLKWKKSLFYEEKSLVGLTPGLVVNVEDSILSHGPWM
jgi:hypothetical protein